MQISNFMEKPPPEIYGLSTSDERVFIGNFIFQSIICKGRGVSCELDVKIYSRVPFGSVYHLGDLDNRIKTLFDALCVPNKDQLAKSDYPARETLFWILLQDDSLITDFCVKTERLLTPGSDSEVEVDIIVTIKRPNSLFR